MRKHFLAIVAIVLVLAATACTQYPDNWMDYFPNMPESNTIKTIEDLYLFLASDGDGEAEVNLTTDLSWFPISVRGNKTITGKLNVTESASSDITPPQSAVTRSASAKVLFEIEDGAAATLSNFTVSIPSEVTNKVASVVSVDAGTIKADNFNVVVSGAATVTGITIGENTAAANVSITNSKPGKIDIATGNEDSDDILKDITENNTDIPQEDISTRFDAANSTELIQNLDKYKKAILTEDISISFETLPSEWQEILYNSNNKKSYDVMDFKNEYSIDLNKFTITSYVGWHLSEDAKVHVSNGTLKMQILDPAKDWSLTNGSIELTTNSALSFDNVTFSSDIVGIFLSNCNNGMSLEISDSTLDIGGYYGIGTNATGPESEDITINIYRSTISAENGGDPADPCTTTIFFNVKGNITIEDSTIIGNRHAMLARGGEHTVRNSTFIVTGNDHDGNDYSTEWQTGNAVPLAAIVIGNMNSSDAYAYGTDFTFDNVIVKAPLQNRADNPLPYNGIYIWENKPEEPVVVRGTVIESPDSEAVDFLNKNMNGADITDLTVIER